MHINIKECLFGIANDTYNSLSLIEKNLRTIALCIEVVRSTNSIIVMNMSLCIDYIKARNDVELSPQSDSINVKDSVEYSINMIKNQDFRLVHISFDISSSLSENIVTDRMWFQESIYTILSYAIKKSSESSLKLSLSLKSFLKQKRTTHGRVLPMIVEESQHSEFNETEDLVSSGIYAKCGVIERCPDEDQSSKMYMLLEFQGAALGVDVPFDLTLEAFEAFHQSIDDNAEASLYCLAKRLEALRGNYGVSVRKDDKTGCVLWFMIPYLPDTSYCSPRLERLSHLSHKSSELKRSQFKLLIICDEYSLLLTSRDSLLDSGYISEYVDNGPDALKMTMDQSVAGTPYDAVLLDLDIPMKGNINYVRRLRQSEKARTDNLIPQLVIGVSQSMEYRETADALHSGVNAFASHPISCDYLYDIINTFRSSLPSTQRDKNSNSPSKINDCESLSKNEEKMLMIT
jgi:CheY-like chemotaxis protein